MIEPHTSPVLTLEADRCVGRISPIDHGWRPPSATYQPVCAAIQGNGKASKASKDSEDAKEGEDSKNNSSENVSTGQSQSQENIALNTPSENTNTRSETPKENEKEE